MNRIYLSLLPILLLVASCSSNYTPGGANAREKALFGKVYTSIPLNKYNDDNRYWAEVKIADRNMKMLLDTGANSTDIDKVSANSAGIKQNTNYEVISKGALGREIRSKLSVTKFKYGPQIISPFVVVINEAHKKGSSVGKYNGQIGLDALVESAAVVDIASKKVWMPQRDILSHSRHPRLGKNTQLGFESLPLYSSGKYSHLILKGNYQGRVTRWIVDTGAEVSIIDSTSAKKLGMNVIQTQSKMIDISGDSSKLGFTIAKNLSFGKTNISNLPIAVTGLEKVKESFRLPNGSTVDGILGVDFLIASQALIDPRSKLIHMGHLEYKSQGDNRIVQNRAPATPSF